MFITNDLRHDGFGAQYQSIIWSILWAECQGHVFHYSEIERMVNDTGDEKKFIDSANNLINLRDKYPPITIAPHGSVIFALKWPYFYKDIEKNMEFFHNSSSFQRIQESYFSNKQSPLSNDYYNVSVHIRRPVAFDLRVEGTATPDSYYLKCMKVVMDNTKSSKPIRFHIYSQGSEEDFHMYKSYPVVFHLKDDTFESFNGMVFADLLVISASSMSYTAGLLSKGQVIYLPFWHPPRKDWLLLA